jgi:hypothetical protein
MRSSIISPTIIFIILLTETQEVVPYTINIIVGDIIEDLIRFILTH